MLNWFLSHKKQTQKVEAMSKKYLIVGLGNIGADYVNTRHNIGFKALNHFANTHNIEFENRKLGALASYKLKGRIFLLLKPNTFMNLSGKAIKYWLDKEKIPMANLLVVTDDLNLSFGTLRFKTKGSDGGHNGLKDIQDKLNTTQYSRLRFGISDEFSKGRQVDYVLGVWSDEESSKLDERLSRVSQSLISFGMSGINETMNQFNGK
jgi:PTH1 family peptidyl-tRNA hydrolase